jgi:MarR family transcriptional regulator, 2-MHQ and catechol-resistance regulon repressor
MTVRFLRTIRLLAECYQAFEQTSGRHVRQLGVTPAQFDLIATLGRTEGMGFKELSEKTLITKGTLSGVIDRLAERGLLARESVEHDGRASFIRLTAKGERLFDQIFPAHIEHLRQSFESFSTDDFDRIDRELARMRDVLRT